MSRYGEIAAALEVLAEWGDYQLAGGQSPKLVAMAVIRAARQVAVLARSGELPADITALVMRETVRR